jgi:LDH2 family malate/lactate/ureidoglycolate dehydrogenase
MVEVLGGLLTGIGYAADSEGIHNDGVFLAVFDVRRFQTLEAFERDMSEFIEYFKSTPRAPGVDEFSFR